MPEALFMVFRLDSKGAKKCQSYRNLIYCFLREGSGASAEARLATLNSDFASPAAKQHICNSERTKSEDRHPIGAVMGGGRILEIWAEIVKEVWLKELLVEGHPSTKSSFSSGEEARLPSFLTKGRL